MYEKINGSKRLINSLHDVSFDESKLDMLACILNYYKPQLIEDLKALKDISKDITND